ncbi:hypothetical protein MHBO_003168 [Bonamia ostreae]|uniref:37S ribosomal protein S25, mitochondrial n=1 Tax=Bonamia ostreae TaxID=126728 RepID=A0ABV2AQ19_9EUKA
MFKKHMQKGKRRNVLSRLIRLNDAGLERANNWQEAAKIYPPDVVLKYPKPPKIKLERDQFYRENKLRIDNIPQIYNKEDLDGSSSPEYQIARAQSYFSKRGYKRNKAYYLAKLLLRNQQAILLRQSELSERKRIDPENKFEGEDILSAWENRLREEIDEGDKRTPPKELLAKITAKFPENFIRKDDDFPERKIEDIEFDGRDDFDD